MLSILLKYISQMRKEIQKRFINVILQRGRLHKITFHFRWTHTGLSTLPDNPGDSRFLTVSPGLQRRVAAPVLQIHVCNLPDNCQSLVFAVDSRF